MNFPHRVTVRRLQQSGGQAVFADLTVNQEAFVQPLDIESSNILNQSFSKGSYAFLPITADIHENDRIVWDGDIYDVKGVKSYKFGNLTHKKALLEEST